jgi:hypothetical protein
MDLQSLTSRLDRLERENRRWMLAAGIGFAALALLIMMVPAGPTTIIRERIVTPSHVRPVRP